MKTGIISIIGKPNVGKSTLINNIFKDSITIVSPKPQTTRNKIAKVYNDDNYNILFFDTPGFHKPINKLDLFLNSQVKSVLKKTDLVFFIFDTSRKIDNEDLELIDQLKKFNVVNLIFILNKTDYNKQNLIDEKIDYITNNFANSKYILMSLLKKPDQINDLIQMSSQYLHESDHQLFNEDDYVLDDKFIISEIIRNEIINLFRQEVPYSCAVVVNKLTYNEQKNLMEINADIFVEKESQKPLLIGKNAKMIKSIGTNARTELLKIYKCKIFLELYVKVKQKWRNNDQYIKNFGYKK